ncbi:MAG: hypothetical protein AB1468_03430 [Candidatus Micrarchaeota archaeon]
MGKRKPRMIPLSKIKARRAKKPAEKREKREYVDPIRERFTVEGVDATSIGG